MERREYVKVSDSQCVLEVFAEDNFYARLIHTWQGISRAGRNSRPRGQNFALNGTQGEDGVFLKKNFFLYGDSFSFSHHTNASCGDTLLPLHHIFPSILWQKYV